MFAKSGSKSLRNQTNDLFGAAQSLKEAMAPHVDTAKSQLADARDQLGPMLADARDAAAPHVADARDRLVTEVIPAVQAASASAREQAGPIAQEARRRGLLAAQALKGDAVPAPTRGRKGRLLVLLGLLGLGAFAAKKVLGSDDPAWQATSYSATHSGSDAAAATPDEAAADAGTEPMVATTPDAPAEVTDVTDPAATPTD